jgi:hypothetical protein
LTQNDELLLSVSKSVTRYKVKPAVRSLVVICAHEAPASEIAEGGSVNYVVTSSVDSSFISVVQV